MANTFKNKLERQIGTSLATIESYTVPTSTECTVIGLTISNTSASTIKVDVLVNDSTNDFYVVKEAPVPSGGSLVVVGGEQKLVLTTGDALKKGALLPFLLTS